MEKPTRLVFATHNQGKLKEMRQILKDLAIEVLSAEEAGIFEDVVEDGETFAENALKKARFVAGRTGMLSVSDDSGLCIRALDGAPGVFSARWAGEGASGSDLVALTISKMEGKADRNAWFESAVALCHPDGREWVFSGKIEGLIPKEPKGSSRPKLPYDVIFIPEGHKKTFAEMSDEEKNSLSHRGEAFRQMKEFVKKEFFDKI